MTAQRSGWLRGSVRMLALLLAVAAPVVPLPSGVAGAGPGGRDLEAAAQQLSAHPIAADSRWRHYVLDQNDGLVYPKRVYVVAGNRSQVRHPRGLMAPGGAVTTIRSSGQGRPRLVLDLGIDAGGYVEVGVRRSDGTTIHLGYSEARHYLTPDGDNPNDPSSGNDDDPGGRSDDITASGNWRSPAVRGGERWISLQLQSAGTVAIDYVRIRSEHLHPSRRDYTGHFLSSDRLLNRIWYAGAYTFTLDSIKDLRPGHRTGRLVVVDGAKRDREVWLGDLVIENLLGDYAVRQAPRIIRNSLNLFSCQQAPDGSLDISSQVDVTCPRRPPPPSSSNQGGGFLPEYTAWWVAALHDYYMMTGDAGFVRRMLPVARRAVAYYTNNLDGNGLYTTREPAINWHIIDVSQGEDSHTNAAIYRALADLADLERRLGTDQAARRYDRRAASLRRAMLAHLWDRNAGAFVVNSNDPRRDHTQDAQVEAVYDGILTRPRAERALHFIATHLRTRYGVQNSQYRNDPYMTDYISPYISSTELLARLQLHQTDAALALIRREWGHMVNTDPHTGMWERMSLDGAPSGGTSASDGLPGYTPSIGAGYTSLAHGWAGGPVPALSQYVLGIRPATPGFRRWIVQPQPGNLRFAQGQAPTPRGVVVSRWIRGTHNASFVLTAGGPRGTHGTVAVPLLGSPRVIARDGRIVWDGRRAIEGAAAWSDGRYVYFRAGAGRHTYAWAGEAGR